ncbi:MAG: Ribosomal RNA small subunit methyltransferase I [Acidimicrobiaceae bacterium]|nr:Ribosomal RNA small subunit methyltransferase I [Acidimicrobiaceae bacterium]
MSAPSGAGLLILVATPIGNLGDLSQRAVEVLSAADLIACEDTRRTGRLLSHAGITGSSLLRLDQHTEEAASGKVIRRLSEGASVAVVTDAGTPGIADPGERLVRSVLDAGFEVSVVPGPSAPVAALVMSGLATTRWCMEGFLPRGGTARTARLAELAVEERTIVLFESPRRLAATLADLAGAFGSERQVAVAREVTKLHEEVWRGSLSEASDWAATPVKGEIVLVVGGAPPAAGADDDRIRVLLAEARGTGASTRDAADEVARRLGVSRRRAYRLALEKPAL